MTAAPTHSAARARRARAAVVQDGVLVVIVLLVGLMAGAASFNHVHDFTIADSPTAPRVGCCTSAVQPPDSVRSPWAKSAADPRMAHGAPNAAAQDHRPWALIETSDRRRKRS